MTSLIIPPTDPLVRCFVSCFYNNKLYLLAHRSFSKESKDSPMGHSNHSIELDLKTLAHPLLTPPGSESRGKEGSYWLGAGWVINPDYQGEFRLLRNNGSKQECI